MPAMNKTKQQSRALIEATLRNDVAEIRRLLAEGTDADSRDSEHGETALMLARSEEAAKLLLDSGADVNARDVVYGRTPFLATGQRILLDRGADINATDNAGQTALMYAVRAADIEGVRQLIERGANVNVQDEEGETALSLAQAYGLIAIGEFLKSVGAKLREDL